MGQDLIVATKTGAVSELPDSPGIYFLRSVDKLLYVGESRRLRERWQNHELAGFLKCSGVSLWWSDGPDADDTRRCLEGRLIEALKPRLNGKSSAFRYFVRAELNTGVPADEIFWNSLEPVERELLTFLKRMASK